MSIATNLRGRLRNTSLPVSSGMLPLYEAVANAIHSIEDAKISNERGRISVVVVRDGQGVLSPQQAEKKPGPEPKGEIVGFRVIDNGLGFTDANIDSFLTLDSDFKASRGGRGVGRLLWLKAFDRAIVNSVYLDAEGKKKRRQFRFDARDGVGVQEISDANDAPRTTEITLHGFARRYREATPKTAKVIAYSLLEHCLWYFVRSGGAPQIEVVDGLETIDLDSVYDDQMVRSATLQDIKIKGTTFSLIHVKLSASSTRQHAIAYCAANRVVVEELLKGKVPGLFGSLHDNGRDFVYECYVSSEMLDERVRSERTSFDIEEEPLEMFASSEVSKKDIRDAVTEAATKFLDPFLQEKRKQSKERVAKFVATKAPRYRPIMGRIPDGALVVDPAITDKDLDLALHRQLAEIENRLLADGHDVMHPKASETYAEYNDRVHEYLKTAEDIKRSDLANYVAHRRVILDLLQKAIERGSSGKYAREDLIHQMVMPMGTTSDGVHFDSCNLWLVDERLAFHDYLASDKTIASMPITGDDSTKEPDILALHVYDNPVLVSDKAGPPLASIDVVELKRPMRNDAAAGEDKDPVEQALMYLDRVRKGKVKTASGRPLPRSEDIPGYCYVVCDITETVERRCRLSGYLTPTHDFLGYFGYNPNFKAYVEVISYTQLVNAAKERNRAFFDKLGLPSS